jgi:hypothetical protein
MAVFLLRLPSEMRDHLIAKDFKDSTLVAEYADLLHSSRASYSVVAVNPSKWRPSMPCPEAGISVPEFSRLSLYLPKFRD